METHVGIFLEKSVYFSQQFKLEDFLLNDNVYKHDHQFHTQKISLGKEKIANTQKSEIKNSEIGQ
jgi:hypothetical protein